jgi:hypothetical protein
MSRVAIPTSPIRRSVVSPCSPPCALLTRLAQDRPLVIAIDDLQWADDDSLALLQEIARPGAQRSADRRDDAERARAPRLIVGAPATRCACSTCVRCRQTMTRQLAHQLAARGGAELLLETVANESGGHPMFVQEARPARAADGSPVGRAG